VSDLVTRSQHMFVVRMWHEASAVVPVGQWRGSVEHLASGQRQYFHHLPDMLEFISARLLPNDTPESTDSRVMR
jgi:hypothetical protein